MRNPRSRSTVSELPRPGGRYWEPRTWPSTVGDFLLCANDERCDGIRICITQRCLRCEVHDRSAPLNFGTGGHHGRGHVSIKTDLCQVPLNLRCTLLRTAIGSFGALGVGVRDDRGIYLLSEYVLARFASFDRVALLSADFLPEKLRNSADVWLTCRSVGDRNIHWSLRTRIRKMVWQRRTEIHPRKTLVQP